MGGSGGGGKSSGSAPPQAQTLDYEKLMRASSQAATAQVRQQYASLIENYPRLEQLSLGTVDKISDRLGSGGTPIYKSRPIYRWVSQGKNKDGKRRPPQLQVVGYRKVRVGTTKPNKQTIDALARIRQGLAIADMSPDAANPTSIEQALYDQGERELALGRSLSPEQERAAQQSARAAFSARGLGTSLGSSAAEILNRDAAATARERERQGFASAANDQYINNITNRRINLANMYYAGAGNLIAADPYARALGPGLQYSGGTQGNQMQQIGNTFSSANQMAGNVASFNANMLDSRYNSYMNNQAAMQAARMQAGATNNAATMGMIGAGAGAAIGIGAIAI